MQKKNGSIQGKRRMNSRTSMAQKDDVIRRTVYVSDIDQQVTTAHLAWALKKYMSFAVTVLISVVCFLKQITEEQLASLFLNCGQVYFSLP